MANELEVRLPGQLDLIAQVDIDRHARKRSGLPVTQYAMRRAQGVLTLLPQAMMPATVTENADGSLLFVWERHDEIIDVVLQMCALASGGLRYHYVVTKGKNVDKAGGILKPQQSDPQAVGIVRGVVTLLTPKDLRTPTTQQRLS